MWGKGFAALVMALLMFSVGQAQEVEQGSLAGFLPDASTVPTFTSDEPNAVDVLQVIDGETVKCNVGGREMVIRLLGIDTPGKPDGWFKGEPYCDESYNYLTNLLIGEQVYIRIDMKRPFDLAERLRANVYRAPDGLWVNLEMVRDGYARVDGLSHFKDVAMFKDYEQRAKINSKGLWALTGE